MKNRSHHADDWVNGSWTVDCVCGVTFDDGEEMVNCDECGVWVHTRCSRYVKGDDIFSCDKCKISNSNRTLNDTEETEVAQLLVDLPTKSFRLWAEVPLDERVHVHGRPGGDPGVFGAERGSPVFSPELWKCAGFVPKKFNFRYREFPCWDEERDEGGENPVDKGAGVLFSLSKERDRRKVCLKEERKGEEEGGLVRNKRRRDDSRGSRRKRVSSKTVFYDDRAAPKFGRFEARSGKNKEPKEMVVSEPASNGNVKEQGGCSVDTEVRENKACPHRPEGAESFLGIDDAVCSLGDHVNAVKMQIKEEQGDGMSVSRLDDCLEVSDKKVDNPRLEDVPESVEVEDIMVQELNGDLSLKSEQPAAELKEQNLVTTCGSLGIVQYSPLGDTKDFGISSDHKSETSKLNGTVIASRCSDHKGEDLYQSSEAASDSHVNKAVQLPDDLCLLESELEGTEGLMALQKSPTEKHGSGLPGEHSKPGGYAPNSLRKLVACSGKSTLNTELISKSPTYDNVRSAEARYANPFAKQPNIHDGSVGARKDRASHEGRDENLRRTVKDRPKSVVNPIPKPSNSSRISHDSLPKKTTAESKENFLSASSKATSAASTAAVTSGPGEHQKATHTHSRSSALGLSQKGEKPNQSNFQPPSKINQNHVPSVCPPISSSSPAALSDEELALLLHQELNSSPRVPRVPRARQAGTLPQLASPSATTMLLKRASSSGGKDHSSVPRRKYRDAPRDGFRSSREAADEAKRMDRVSSSHDPKRRDTDYITEEASTKREDNGSSAMESVKKNAPSTSAASTSGPSSSNEANDRNLTSIRSSPRNNSDDDTGTVGGPAHRTLPGLISEIMSKGRRITYEELCNAVLPHWHNLRKHNGEKYAYSSHSQAVLDCLRNRHEWARLVDRGPKTNSSRKKRKPDAEDSEDNNDYDKAKTANPVESKSLESQKEDFPKGKRKARKRRRLALQGKGVKDIRKRRKQDRFTDDDFGSSSNTSEESVSSETGALPDGSEASSSAGEERTT